MIVTKTRAVATAGEPLSQAPRGFQGDPPPRRSRAILRTLDDVAVELARLYRRAERGQIPTADASRLAYMLTSLAKVMEAARQAPLPTPESLKVNTVQPLGLADLYQAMETLQMDRLEEAH